MSRSLLQQIAKKTVFLPKSFVLRSSVDVESGGVSENAASSTAFESRSDDPNTGVTVRNRKTPAASRPSNKSPETLGEENTSSKTFDKLFDELETESKIFLLRGRPGSASQVYRALPVGISDTDDSYAAFMKLRQRYDQSGSKYLGRYLTLRGVFEVVPAELRIIKPHPSGHLLATLSAIDLAQHARTYERASREKRWLNDSCRYNEATSTFHHSDFCLSQDYDVAASTNSPGDDRQQTVTQPRPSCGLEHYHAARGARLDIVTVAAFLSVCWRDPDAARWHDVLRGFEGVDFLYTARSFGESLHDQGVGMKLRHYQLYGLYLQEGWLVERICAAGVALTAVVVVVGKLAWGGWDVVFGAGSFFVAAPMLVLAALSYYD